MSTVDNINTEWNFHETAQELLTFVEQSPSAFHAAANAADMLENAGFARLSESSRWGLETGHGYYVTRNGSSLIAFRIPKGGDPAFRLFSSHTDSPTFKIKENPEMDVEHKYTKLNVEKYGGMLMAPWFDRPLSVAGRVLVDTGDGIETRLIQIDRDLLMIPNVAIHMNRDINDGMKYNAQIDLCPVFGDAQANGRFNALIAQEAGVREDQILGKDLFLYNRQKGAFLGAKEEYIGSPRLDDLQCMFGSLKGFLMAEESKDISVFCAFDNEETGSVSRQGAASTFLHEVLARINRAIGGDEEDYLRRIASSFMISADNSHAVHPNHAEKADPVNRPEMNQGIVMKFNANQKYTTDGKTSAIFRKLCSFAGVPWQVYTNRSDIAGGSTLGNISNTQVSLPAVDIGLAQLAMHSPYEMAGTKDTEYLVQLAKTYFSSEMTVTDEKITVC